MSSIVQLSLITLLSISNSNHGFLTIGTSIQSSCKIQNSEYFNRNHLYYQTGDEKMRAIKIVLPYLDNFFDDNVIPIDHDVVIKNEVNGLTRYNPYYFSDHELYNNYFESIANSVQNSGSDVEFIRDYFIQYFSTIGYGTNRNNDYYDLYYYGTNYLNKWNGLSTLQEELTSGRITIASFSSNPAQVSLGLILSVDTKIILYNLSSGYVTDSVSEGYVNEIVSLKLNTSHYCSDNYIVNGSFKCFGCGNTTNNHHDHYTTQTTPEQFTHKFECNLCHEMIVGDHSYGAPKYYNALYHEMTCTVCGYKARVAHIGGNFGNNCPCRLTSE